jgi:glycosyltransferase involved in cell wall biosynthesis
MSLSATEPIRPAVWFPAIASSSGVDVYTETLCDLLNRNHVQAGISWLNRDAEFLPWMVRRPQAPEWANVAHINSCLHRRFIPSGLPWVATIHHVVHDPAFKSYKSRWQALYHQFWVLPLERYVLRNAARVVAVSRFTAQRAESVFGIRSIDVIPNWVDTQRFRPGPRDTPHHPFRLVYVGNLSRRKGADLLPRIVERLGAGFELRFTGGLKGLKHVRPLPPNMIPLGRIEGRDQMVRLFQECDALLCPSRLEGFGLAAAEAQACGIPVVATCGSALPEVVRHGVSGLLCPQDDVGAFVEAVGLLAQDHGTWRRFRADARAWAEEQLSEAGKASAYTMSYRRAIEG